MNGKECAKYIRELFADHGLIQGQDNWELGQELANETLSDEQIKCLEVNGVSVAPNHVGRQARPAAPEGPPDELLTQRELSARRVEQYGVYRPDMD